MNNVAIIGNPNVGKSLVLNRLTGSQLLVSNYPGTSLEISPTNLRIGPHSLNIYDTPGIYSLFSSHQEAAGLLAFLKGEGVDFVIDIVDAVNLERNLVLTLELLSLDKPVVVLLNQVDRARNLGMVIDTRLLEQHLGVQVIPFSASTGEGLEELLELLHHQVVHQGQMPVQLHKTKPGLVGANGQGTLWQVSVDSLGCTGNCRQCSGEHGDCWGQVDLERAEVARNISAQVLQYMRDGQKAQLHRLQALIDHPWWGTLIILGLAYMAFHILLQFIQLSEGPLGQGLEPAGRWLAVAITTVLPPGMITTILAQAVPEGIIIPVTIIMPAMLMVSLIMALLEDTGLLPRYSVALERLGSLVGVSGQAVIPLALGFGCRTPAILATRILPSAGQRFLVVALLSIVIPCSATLGILASVIAAFHASLLSIGLTMLAILMLLSYLLSRNLPRDNEFIYELPPLRIPLGSNLVKKMKIRFAGFFTEILPLLIIMNIGLRALMESGFFQVFGGLEPMTRFIFGIPAEAFVAVLLTVFQRYLAPIVLMNTVLTPREATIAISMIALSLPCLPMMVMTVRELGWGSLVKILGMGLATSCLVGMILNVVLPG